MLIISEVKLKVEFPIRVEINDMILASYSGQPIPYEILNTETNSLLPTSYDLNQNYPNPFNASTTIKYQLPESDNVKLSVYDIRVERLEYFLEVIRKQDIMK